MQRVLDIDLDLFLADCCPLAEAGERPDVCGHEPWREDEVRRFLEESCGLSREKPVSGRVFETHDAALYTWQELMERGILRAPFSVTHADAHSDLGIGFPGPGFILNTVIATRMDVRCDTERYIAMHELDEANYLLFAAAYRIIGELINVRNPKSREDIPREILCLDEEGGRTGIRLSSFVSRLTESINGREPLIPYREYRNPHDFRAEGSYSFMTLAMSPRYAPREADALAAVVREYMAEEKTR